MRRLFGILGSIAGGTVGWWLGAFAGILSAYIAGTIGTGVGLWAGYRVADRYLP